MLKNPDCMSALTEGAMDDRGSIEKYAHERLFHIFRRFFSSTKGRVILFLLEKGAAQQQLISKCIHMDEGQLRNVVKVLEDEKYVHTEYHTHCGHRHKFVYLNKQKLLNDMQKVLIQVKNTLLGSLQILQENLTSRSYFNASIGKMLVLLLRELEDSLSVEEIMSILSVENQTCKIVHINKVINSLVNQGYVKRESRFPARDSIVTVNRDFVIEDVQNSIDIVRNNSFGAVKKELGIV